MIPPIPPSILTSNPQFASLYKALTTKILEHDASTKITNTSHQSAEEQLTTHLKQAAKERILAQSLQDLIFSDGDDALPEELRELVYIVSSYLLSTPRLTVGQTELLAQDIERVNLHMPRMGKLLSRDLETQHSHLYQLAKASSPTLSKTDQLSRYSLQLHLKDTLTHLSTLHQVIQDTTTTLINTLASLLTLQTSYLTFNLTHLSQFTHGTFSRHNLSKSSNLSTVSQTLSAKIQLLSLENRRSIYNAPTQTALTNYSTHLDSLRSQLDTRIRTLEDELRLYSDCDGRDGETIEELGQRYGQVLREIEEVKADVERLEREGRNGKGTARQVSRRDYGIP